LSKRIGDLTQTVADLAGLIRRRRRKELWQPGRKLPRDDAPFAFRGRDLRPNLSDSERKKLTKGSMGASGEREFAKAF